MYDWLEDVKMDSNISYATFEPFSTHEIKNDPGAEQNHQQDGQTYAPMFQDVQLDGLPDVNYDPGSLHAFLDAMVKPEPVKTENTQPEGLYFAPPPIAQGATAANNVNTYGMVENGHHATSQSNVNTGTNGYQSGNGNGEAHQTQEDRKENDFVEFNALDANGTNEINPAHHNESGQELDTPSSEPAASYAVNGYLPIVLEPDGFVAEPLCRIKSFYIGGAWPMGANYDSAKHRFGQMYVEQMDPPRIHQPHAIVFLHGDFHHGKIWQTKPDGDPGWASFFLQKGYQVFIVDLPPSGRSNFLTPMNFKRIDIERVSQAITAADVERTLTNPGAVSQYSSAELHTQWPGTGRRGCEMFDAHCDSLDTLTVPKRERQNLGQHAMAELLKKLDRKAILIGEGARSNIAWLAADVFPEQVAAVIAVEPAGPPFGKPARTPNGSYTGSVHREPSVRAYGLTDIPLTYDPPARAPESIISLDSQDVLDVVEVARDGTRAVYFMQDGADTSGRTIIRNALYPSEVKGRVRQLVQLQKVPHAVITGEAGAHTQFDWATVAFMRQAGLDVNWLKLEEHGIKGNGHLMFLERNSDKIADLVERWIRHKMVPAPAPARAQSVAYGDEVGIVAQSYHRRPPVQPPYSPGSVEEAMDRIINGAAPGYDNGVTTGTVNGIPAQQQHHHTTQDPNSAIDDFSTLQQTQPAAPFMDGGAIQRQYMVQNTNGVSANNVMQLHQLGPNATNAYQAQANQAHTMMPQQQYSAASEYIDVIL